MEKIPWDKIIEAGCKPSASLYSGPLMIELARFIQAKILVEIGVGFGFCSVGMSLYCREVDGKYHGVEIKKDRVELVNQKIEEFGGVGKVGEVEAGTVEGDVIDGDEVRDSGGEDAE